MYKLTEKNENVIRLADNAFIPADPDNTDYQQYLEWLSEGNTPEPVDPPTPAQIQQEIIDATQKRLDTFARTKGYDGILSACTYATSAVPQFQTEGQYCVSARDATWASLYQILAEVQTGTRPVPTGYADIEADLPVLEWPA